MRKKLTFKEKCKTIPWYGWMMGIGMILIQFILIGIGWLISRYAWPEKYWWSPAGWLDQYIPFIPYGFLTIYLSWIIFLPIGAVINGKLDKKRWVNLMIAWISTLAAGCVIYCCFPSFIDRNNIVGVPGGSLYEYAKGKTGLCWWVLTTFMWIEPRTWCPCPSFHCINIIFCYLGVARQRKIKLGWRISQLFITIIICISTFVLKQHYILDFFVAFAMCLIGYMFVFSFDPATKILKKRPNFLIIPKLNWANEKIIPLSKRNKGK